MPDPYFALSLVIAMTSLFTPSQLKYITSQPDAVLKPY